MVMGPLARHVRVLAGGQVDPLDEAESLERLERPEDRRSPGAGTRGPGRGDEVGGGEVPVLRGDQFGQGPSRGGPAEAGAFERDEDGSGVSHGRR